MVMNSGDGEASYANNSGLQKVVISKTLPFLEDALKAMYTDHLGQLPKLFKIVDLGSSSGPNSLFAMSCIVNTIEDLYKQNKKKKNIHELPEFEVFLSDLPDNDFNNLFKLIPNFYQAHEKEKERGNVFVYGLPGSFYGQLFPKKSLHFAYSSYSLHWLSRVPKGLQNNNRENIYIATTSGPEVVNAYKRQYQSDFSAFLRLRAQEIVTGGRMVLTFIGRSVDDPTTKEESAYFILLVKVLLEMVTEGLVNLEDLYSFNVPIYMPSKQEVVTEIQSEGSFTLEKLHDIRVRWDANENTKNDMFFDEYRSGKLVADCIRAFMEPLLASHFGSSIIDNLFERYAKKMGEHLSVEKLKMGEHLSVEKSSHFTIVISLSRK